MAHILRKIGNASNVSVYRYEEDTEADMRAIDVSMAPMGSRCYIINTGDTYALNSNKEWKPVPKGSGGDIIYDGGSDSGSSGDIIYDGGTT